MGQADKMLAALGVQAAMKGEQVLRRIVAAWLAGQRKGYGGGRAARESDGIK